MRKALMTAPRAPSDAPPPGYRPHMPLAVRLNAVLIWAGFDPLDVDWHHQPPLQQRVWDAQAHDTIPAANDPHYIVPMAKAAHKKRTAKIDVPEIHKTRHLSEDHEAFRARMLAKGAEKSEAPVRPKRKIPSRPLSKRKPKP